MKPNRFSQQVMENFLTKFLLIILKFLIVVVTAGLFGVEGRGLFVSLIQSTGFITNILSISVGDSLIHQVASNNIDKTRLIKIILILTVIISIPILFVILFFQTPLQTNFKLGEYTYYLFLLAPGFLFEYFTSSVIRGLKKHKELNLLSIINRSLVLIFISSGYFIQDPLDFQTMLNFYYSALMVNCILYFFALRNLIPDTSKRANSRIWKNITETIKYGSTIHPMVLTMEVENRFDIFVILYFVNLSAVGIYSIAVTLSQIAFYVSNSISTIFFPHLSSKSTKDPQEVYLVINYTFAVVLILTLILIPISYALLKIFFAIDFFEAFYVLLILLPAVLFDSISRIIITWGKSDNRGLRMLPATLSSLVVNIFLSILLVYYFGIFGAALATLITYTLRSYFLIRIFKLTTNLDKKIFPNWGIYTNIFQQLKNILLVKFLK